MNGMVGRLILRRLALGILTLFLVSIGVFFITNLLPGDAAQTALGQAATPETVAALRLLFGLDLPIGWAICWRAIPAFRWSIIRRYRK